MDLLSFFAKLVMDSTDYNDKLDAAQAKADKFKGVPEQKIPVDTKEFKDGIAEAEGDANAFQQVLSGVWEGIKDSLKVAGVGAAIAKLTQEMGKAVNLSMQLSDTVDKGSKSLNISTDAYQEWNHVLGQSGASITDLKKGVSMINDIIGNGANKDQASLMARLGIDYRDQQNTEQFLENVMKALADFGGPTEERNNIAEAIFGKSQASSLFALLDEGSSGIESLMKEAHDLGLVLTEDQIENSVKLGDSIANMNSALEALKVQFVQNIIPLLTDAVNMVNKIIVFFNGGNKSLAEIFSSGDKALEEEMTTIEGTGAAAQTLADKLIAMGDTSKMTAEQYAVWKGTAEALIGLVPSLSEVINTETGTISANSEEIKDNIKQWEKLAKQKAFQSLKEEKLQAIMGKNKDLVEKQVEVEKKAADAEKARVEAYHNFNDEMKSRGLGELDFNGDVGQQISDLMSSLADQGDSAEADLLALGTALKKIGEADRDAAKAKEDADKLAKEIEKAEKEYEDWLAAAEKLYGGLTEDENAAEQAAKDFKKALDGIPDKKVVRLETVYEDAEPKAIGMNYVPYDNYPALLHRGEKVLTATEARKESGQQIDLTGLEDKIISAIERGMANTPVNSYLNGRLISDEVSRTLASDLAGRRFL